MSINVRIEVPSSIIYLTRHQAFHSHLISNVSILFVFIQFNYLKIFKTNYNYYYHQLAEHCNHVIAVY